MSAGSLSEFERIDCVAGGDGDDLLPLAQKGHQARSDPPAGIDAPKLLSSLGIQNEISALKNFYFTEARYVQVRCEAFNLPNHANWGDPDTTLVDRTFGTINSTRTAMRQLQFGLKVVF